MWLRLMTEGLGLVLPSALALNKFSLWSSVFAPVEIISYLHMHFKDWCLHMWNIGSSVTVYSSVPPASLDTFKAQKCSNILYCSGVLKLSNLEKNFPVPQEYQDVFIVPSSETHPEINPSVCSWRKILCSPPYIRDLAKTFNLGGQTVTFKWLGSNKMWFCGEGEFAKPTLHAAHLSTTGTTVETGWADSRADNRVTQNLPDSLPDKIGSAMVQSNMDQPGATGSGVGASGGIFPAPSCDGDEETWNSRKRCSKWLKQVRWGWRRKVSSELLGLIFNNLNCFYCHCMECQYMSRNQEMIISFF